MGCVRALTPSAADLVTGGPEDILRQIPRPACGMCIEFGKLKGFSLFILDVQITGWIDQGLNEKAYIVPGLGDFGERRCVFSFAGVV